MNRHLIQSQKMLLTVDSQQDWEQVQAEISYFCKTRLPEVLENIFDEFALNHTIRIDQLNIDLGNLSLNTLAQDIEEQITIQVYRYLRAHHQQEINAVLVKYEKLISFLTHLKINAPDSGLANVVSVGYLDEANNYETLAFYCETGLKPWWLATTTSFKPAALLLQFLNADAEIFAQFVKAVKHQEATYRRLIQLVGRKMFFYQIHQFTTDLNILKCLERNINDNLFKLIVEHWLSQLEAGKSESHHTDFGLWLFALVEQQPVLKPMVLEALTLTRREQESRQTEAGLVLRLNKLYTAITRQKQGPAVASKPAVNPVDENTKPLRVEGVNQEASILIENAGLVLLYPYFKNLFSSLQLLNAKDFKDEMCMQKAVVYLHYLVYGEMPEDECQLALNKILCGATPETIILFNEISFTDEELSWSDTLKSMVIQHWTKLGSTTIQGLTETFLKRDGSLIFRANNYHVHVERKGFDVLLDTIAWPISIIRLPWNNYLISLNW